MLLCKGMKADRYVTLRANEPLFHYSYSARIVITGSRDHRDVYLSMF
jgi:hypothetical protein